MINLKLALFLACIFEVSTSSVCEYPLNFLDPNKFETSTYYSNDKLTSTTWHEHWQYVIGEDLEVWKSYYRRFHKPASGSDPDVYIEYGAGGKPTKNCVDHNGILFTTAKNSVSNFRGLTYTASGTVFENSVWILDGPKDSFLALVRCDGPFQSSWKNHTSTNPLCTKWMLTVYYGTTERLSDDQYSEDEQLIGQRMCCHLSIFQKAYASPSIECSSANIVYSGFTWLYLAAFILCFNSGLF